MKGIVVFFVVSLLACHGQKKAVDQNATMNQQLVLLVEDGFFPIDSLETHIISDTKTLNTFFRRVNRTRKPGLSVPVVDFTKEVVLVACFGATQGQGMPKLKIVEGKEDHVTLTIEKPEKIASDNIISYPFCVYKMPKTERQIVFKRPERR